MNLTEQQATAAAIACAENMPAAWHAQIRQSGRSIAARMRVLREQNAITAYGTQALEYMEHLETVSETDHTYTVNTLAPLFMPCGDTITDRVRRTMSEGIIKFSGLSVGINEN